MIGVFAALAAVLFPVIGRAKLQAYNSTHISNLRQIGQAREMYAPDGVAKPSFQSEPLVALGYLSHELLDSKFDPFTEGCMNHQKSYDSESGQPITSYKDSLLTAPAYLGVELLSKLLEQKGSGWAIFQASPPQQQNDVPWNSAFEIYTTKYLRLKFDGSVKSGTVILRPAIEDPSILAYYPEDLFYDRQ